MTIRAITSYLESIAPTAYQESYDNAGLIVGNIENKITGVLICLDSTEAVIEEAIQKGCNLVIAHHPIIFKGLKQLTGKTYIERVVMSAIKNDIAIYAIHTNLDNVYYKGVNAKIAEKIGLTDTKLLAPKSGLKKINTYVPTHYTEKVRQQLFNVGAGKVNGHSEVSYATLGISTEGEASGGMIKLELLFPEHLEPAITTTLKKVHPSDHVIYHIEEVGKVTDMLIGSGMIGTLVEPMSEQDFLLALKQRMQLNSIKHTRLLNKSIQKVAVCGGSGGFLLNKAIGSGADIFITSDYKYHEFFDADGKIIIADIGHYESERFTIDLLYEIISEEFSNFAIHRTEVNTNPVFYY